VAPVTHKRTRRLLVITVVAALHAGVCWVFLKATLPLKIRTATSSLELTYLLSTCRKAWQEGRRRRPVSNPSCGKAWPSPL